MNAENSRSAICVCCLQIELENDSFVFIGAYLCDHTRGVATKQLDHGIDHTFISGSESEAICPSFLFRLVPLEVFYVGCQSGTEKPIPKYNGHSPTGRLILIWELMCGAAAERLGEELP
jgi:hypothetical protein